MPDTEKNSRVKRNSLRLSVRELAELSTLTALIIGGKEAMNFLPNIHPVTLLLILCVRMYGVKALYPAVAFSLIETLLYGVSIWTVSYLYVWPLSVAVMLLFCKTGSRLFWACFAGIFGLCFGALTAVSTLVLSGWRAAVAYWVAGIPYDLIHCVSNFVLTFFLLPPLLRAVERIKAGRAGN